MWLDKTAMKLVGGGPKSLKFIACKVAADTCILGPLNILGFFMVLTLNSGEGERGVKKKRDFKDKVQKDFVSTYLTESAAWVPLQSLNFKFVPVQYHLLVVNLATIVDSAFVCWATANDEWFVKLFPSLVGATIADRAAAVEEERKKKGK
jgi:protein Mpv17